ncbi:glutathione S-transferase family protein [Sulfitobacter sp. LCG007]
MGIEISSFEWVPDFARTRVKTLRPRWALEEAGLEYSVYKLAQGENDQPDYRRWQPFGQVPAYRDETVELFESGAILLHISRKSDRLAARNAQDAARIEAWTFAALNSVEPRVDNLVLPLIFNAGEDWVEGARANALRLLGLRLKSLTGWLEGREWLAERFSVADIAMATVLRGLEDQPVLDEYPVVKAYLQRCLARPAFTAALNKQVDSFQTEAA